MNDIIITFKKLKLHSIYFLKMLNFRKIITNYNIYHTIFALFF